MLKVINLSIFVFLFSFVSSSLHAKSMVQFYGSEKYSASYDYNDLKRVMLSDDKHETRAGYKGIRSIGKHVNLQIFKEGELIFDKQKPHQSIHTIAMKDDPLALENLGACHYYSCLLYTSPSPRDQRGSRMPSSA